MVPLPPGHADDPDLAPPDGWPGVTTDAGELAVVTRSGFVESRHVGHAVLLDQAGDMLVEVGNADVVCYPRSSLKPLQAAAVLLAGADLSGARLAMSAASHRGHPDHLELVAAMLADAGLGPADLQTPADLPGDGWARDDFVRAGRSPVPIAHNCSGKHAGMLAACAAAGWDTATYRSPEHPLQLLARRVVEVAAEVPVDHVGVDGCGAPLFTTTPRGLARAFGRLGAATTTGDQPVPTVRDPDEVTLPAATAALAVVGRAMRAHPWTIAGVGAADTVIMQQLEGVVAKGGAEGVMALGTGHGHGVAVKVLDGADRAAPVAALALLGRTGIDVAGIAAAVSPRALGRGDPVGRVHPAPALAP